MYGHLGGGEEEAVKSGREVEVVVQEKQEWGGGRERIGEGKAHTQTLVGILSAVKPQLVGARGWLGHRAGQRASLRSPDLASVVLS